MFTASIYLAAALLLAASWLKDRNKTRAALKKSWKAFENILPQFLAIILLVGLSLAFLDTEDISLLIGIKSGWIGMVAASIVGSVTLIPGFVAFPLTASLYQNGAGLMQLAVFISSLMAVGIVTLPVEIKIFGLRLSILRNALAYIYCFIVALIMGVLLT